MKLESCFICKRLVLELEGQFTKLDTYLLHGDDAAYQQGAFGWCHLSCLSASNWGNFWTKRRIQHMTEIMGFVKIRSSGSLTALQNPRTGEITVLQDDGVSFFIPSSSRLRKNRVVPKLVPGGVLLPILEEMNLEFDDPLLAQETREALLEFKHFPLSKLIEALKIKDCLLYPNAVSDGTLRFSKVLRRDWVGNWVSAIASYNRFIPQAIADLVVLH